MTHGKHIIPLNTISLKHAETLTANWRQVMQPLMGDHLLRGFFIPSLDLMGLFTLHEKTGCLGVRGYLCLTDPHDISSVELILVPVGHDGKDILNIPDASGEGRESTIYDFTQPCPSQCDTSSPLYGLQKVV